MKTVFGAILLDFLLSIFGKDSRRYYYSRDEVRLVNLSRTLVPYGFLWVRLYIFKRRLRYYLYESRWRVLLFWLVLMAYCGFQADGSHGFTRVGRIAGTGLLMLLLQLGFKRLLKKIFKIHRPIHGYRTIG
jgi:hypothetical protein